MSMEGKVVLITGSTDGIGKQTALELARMGATVLVHGRSAARVGAARDELRKASGSARVEAVAGDLSSMRQVRALAKEVEARTQRLDVLLHNAGVFMNQRQVTEDGLEVTFAVNHLAPFLLTQLLLPLLERSAPARVVVVSSIAHQRGRIDLGALQLERGYSGYGAYAASKLANILFTFELAERLAPLRITANCLHPGVIGTKLLREGFGASGDSVEEGARTSVYLASAPELEGVTGRYFVRCQPAPTAPQAQDPELRKSLWEQSEVLCGLSGEQGRRS